MSAIDELIGRNLSKFRGDMSQAELAAAMRENGFKWSQATVWAVEKGDRPLRMAEANALTKIFRKDSIFGLSQFLSSASEMRLRGALEEVARAQAKFKDATSEYLEALDELAITADDVSEADDVEEIENFRWFGVRTWLSDHSPVLDALEAERKHRLIDGHDAEQELLDYGVRTYRELVEARDKEAHDEGFEDYETKWEKSMRLVGNYSGMRKGTVRKGIREDGETDT